MKNLKKILSLAMAVLMLVGLLAGCGGDSSEPTPTNPDGSTAQSKTCVISYNSSGYSHTWLEEAAKAFEELYAEEGYKLDLQIEFGSTTSAALQIPLGPDKNDIDLYMGAGDMEKVLDASNKTMRGEGAVLVDLTDVLWNKPAIGLDKQEEEKTLAERYLLDKEYLYYDGAQEEFHGGIYAIPTGVGSCGIILNPKVTEQFGYGLDNLPRTTDEFNQMCHEIAAKTEETGIYPYAWPGANAPGYITYLFFEYFAQYSGKEAFMNFVKTIPESGDIINDGWKVYEDKGILEGFKCMEPIMKLEYSPKGSVNMTHLEAQHEVLVGNAAFIMNGDWVLNEMEDQYYEECSQCIMMNTPVISVIGVESGITDAELSEAVKMVDEGKTNEEIMAVISGLDDAETQRIRDARNIFGCGEKVVRGGACIPAYADGKDVAILFLRFLFSEDGCQIIRDEAYNIASFACESYKSKGDTVYMDSVVANINPGHGQYISMDPSLSIVRATSGMLYFNHPSMVQPTTFRSMITDTTGTMTAEYMYQSELDYARSHWSQWVAYTGLV